MTNVNAISSTTPGALSAQAQVVAVQAQVTITTSTQKPVTTAAATPPVSSVPRIVSDPLSRVVITQFLNNDGDVVNQVPTSTVVAYLRNGLSPDGFPKTSTQA